jgi:3-oxoadipate CoA-transferase beta subunit
MAGLSNDEIAREIALDLPDGSYVNLGIGLPTLVSAHLPAGREVVFHSENGIVGVGPPPPAGDEDLDLIDAGKRPVTLVPGGAYMSHADSFCVIRGGHLDVAVLGAFEVSAHGDLANWSTGQGLPAVGGAMDLAAGAKTVYVMTRHTTTKGEPKLLTECSLPLTGRAVVSRVYSDLGIFRVDHGSFLAVGLAEGVRLEEVQAQTNAPVVVAAGCVSLPRPDACPQAGATAAS